MDRFAICLAFNHLENDYNKSGWVQERPSNQRRRESIGVQLHRLGFSPGMEGVDIDGPHDPELDDPMHEDVRICYYTHVLKWGLPIDPEQVPTIQRLFVPEYLASFPKYVASTAHLS